MSEGRSTLWASGTLFPSVLTAPLWIPEGQGKQVLGEEVQGTSLRTPAPTGGLLTIAFPMHVAHWCPTMA